jgi:hypothetical protein
MPERRTVQIKTPIAGNSQSIAKIGNAAMRRSELAHFNKQMLIHELIRGSLGGWRIIGRLTLQDSGWRGKRDKCMPVCKINKLHV